MADSVRGPDGSDSSEGLGAGAGALHAAVCQAVALLNRSPEVARCAEGREAHNLLRQALADYADRQEFVIDTLCRMNEAPATQLLHRWKAEIQRAIIALRTA